MLLAALIQIPFHRKMDKQIKRYSDNESTMSIQIKKQILNEKEHGWTSKTRWVKEVRLQRRHSSLFHLYKVYEQRRLIYCYRSKKL